MSEKCKHLVVDYHMHDSLLEDRPEKNLTEAEREAAWHDYENEKEDAVRQEQLQKLREQREMEAAAERMRQRQEYLAQQQQAQQSQAAAGPSQVNSDHAATLMAYLRNLLTADGGVLASTLSPQQQQSPAPQTPRGRGRPPGSRNHEPEKLIQLNMNQVIQCVKTLYPSGTPDEDMYQTYIYLTRQREQVESRIAYLHENGSKFPDVQARLLVQTQNKKNMEALMAQYAQMDQLFKDRKAAQEEQKRLQMQQALAAKARLQEQQRQVLQNQLDTPD